MVVCHPLYTIRNRVFCAPHGPTLMATRAALYPAVPDGAVPTLRPVNVAISDGLRLTSTVSQGEELVACHLSPTIPTLIRTPHSGMRLLN
jgi:hypothetical protein